MKLVVKHIKRATIVLVLIMLSCSKGYYFPDSHVQFDIYSLGGIAENKKSEAHDPTLPQCSEEVASYALIELESLIGISEYRLDVHKNYQSGNQTEVLKLYEGEYKLLSFKVFSDSDVLIWNAPKNDSYYVNLWDVQGIETVFAVKPFKKIKLDVDVMCYYVN